MCGTMQSQQVTMLLMVGSAAFLETVLSTALYPFFPQEAGKKGANVTIVGIIYGCFSVTQLVSSLLIGKLVPCVGAKVLFITGVLISGVCTVMFGLLDKAPSGTAFIALCIVIRCLDGFGTASADTMCFLYMATAFPNNVATMLGMVEIFNGVGMLLGPPLGGLLYDAWGYEVPFVALGSMLLLLLLPLSLGVLPRDVTESDPESSKGGYVKLLRVPTIAIMSLLVCTTAASMSFLRPTMTIFLHTEFQMPPGKIGLVLLGFACSYAIFAPLLGFLSDSFPAVRKVMMTAGVTICSLCFQMLGPIPLLHIKSQVWLLVLVLVIMGICLGSTLVPAYSIILESAHTVGFADNAATLGLVSGLFTSMWCLGECVGPVFGGLILRVLPFPWAASVQGGILFVVAVVMLIFSLRSYCSTDERERQKVSEPEESTIISPDNICYGSTRHLVVPAINDAKLHDDFSSGLSPHAALLAESVARTPA